MRRTRRRRVHRARRDRRPRGCARDTCRRATKNAVKRNAGSVDNGVRANRRVAPAAETAQERRARLARLGVRRASSIVDQTRRALSSSSSRHSTASAPWPTCGMNVAGSNASVMRSSRPRRVSAATAPTIASSSPTRASRVAMLPRNSTQLRSGRIDISRARRRGLPVPTVAPCGRSAIVEPIRQSRTSARSGTRGEHEAGGCVLRRRRQVLGRVHGDIGATVEHRRLHFGGEHAAPAERRQRLARTPIAFGLDDRRARAPPRRAATASACTSARGLPRVAMRSAARGSSVVEVEQVPHARSETLARFGCRRRP